MDLVLSLGLWFTLPDLLGVCAFGDSWVLDFGFDCLGFWAARICCVLCCFGGFVLDCMSYDVFTGVYGLIIDWFGVLHVCGAIGFGLIHYLLVSCFVRLVGCGCALRFEFWVLILVRGLLMLVGMYLCGYMLCLLYLD